MSGVRKAAGDRLFPCAVRRQLEYSLARVSANWSCQFLVKTRIEAENGAVEYAWWHSLIRGSPFMPTVEIQHFFRGGLAHASYLIGSEGSAAVIDPQCDVDVYRCRIESPRCRRSGRDSSSIAVTKESCPGGSPGSSVATDVRSVREWVSCQNAIQLEKGSIQYILYFHFTVSAAWQAPANANPKMFAKIQTTAVP